eukprot:1160508-Pelagomonas_calceolata.AAC.1
MQESVFELAAFGVERKKESATMHLRVKRNGRSTLVVVPRSVRKGSKSTPTCETMAMHSDRRFILRSLKPETHSKNSTAFNFCRKSIH